MQRWWPVVLVLVLPLLAGVNNVPYGPVQICASSCASAANVLTTSPLGTSRLYLPLLAR